MPFRARLICSRQPGSARHSCSIVQPAGTLHFFACSNDTGRKRAMAACPQSWLLKNHACRAVTEQKCMLRQLEASNLKAPGWTTSVIVAGSCMRSCSFTDSVAQTSPAGAVKKLRPAQWQIR